MSEIVFHHPSYCNEFKSGYRLPCDCGAFAAKVALNNAEKAVHIMLMKCDISKFLSEEDFRFVCEVVRNYVPESS